MFQDFTKFELPLRDNVSPTGAPDEAIEQALVQAGAANLASLDTVLARGYQNGTDLSGGQWQRIALARGFMRDHPLLLVLDEPYRGARRGDRTRVVRALCGGGQE